MKTFYYYENSRKRYRASHNSSDGYIQYAVEYKVKVISTFNKKFYNWICMAELVSKLKFKDIKLLIDKKLDLNREIKSNTRVINTNPFLEYMSELG